jgi:predicted Zn-dependent peptidase
LNREYERLLYGDNPLTWQANKKNYEGITSADLKAVHAKYFFPKNIILAASGDFKKAELKTKINKMVSGWKNKSLRFPSFSKKFPKPEPGVYFIEKRINQGYVSLGHLGIEDTNPDYFAVQIMNFILGGGSFTSRITMKVRSDEGLSYSQGSRFRYRWGFPGIFSGYVQTKSSTVGYAISLILDEFNRIRKEPVKDSEMDTAINYYLESFSNSFESPQSTMSSFANLEVTGKPMNYYKTYRSKIKVVTKAKVQEVANKYIHPDKAVIMIVGTFESCNKGGAQWPGPLNKLGKLHTITLRDPLTGEELK